MGKDCLVCPKRGKIHKLLTLCRVFFGGVISDIFFRLFFLWYQRDALCTQIFGCEVETVLMLKGGFCLWGRPPLILRDIQAVSPATYEYGGTFRLSASFLDMRFPNPLTPFTLFFFPFLSVFFSESCRFQPRWVLFSFSFFVLPFPQDSRIRLSLSLAGNGRKVCLVALCSCASLCIAFRLAVCFFVSSPSLFVCLQDGGYGCVCCRMTVLSVVLPAGEWRIRRLFFFFLARSDTGFGGNIRGFGEIKSGVKRNAGGSYEVTYRGWQRGV